MVTQLIKSFSVVTNPQSSLLCSQQSVSGPKSKTVGSVHTLTLCLRSILVLHSHLHTYTYPRFTFNIISIFTGGWDMVYGVTSSYWVSRQTQWPCLGLHHRLGPVLTNMGYCHISSTSTDHVPGGLQSVTGMSCSHKMLSGEQQGQLRAGVHYRGPLFLHQGIMCWGMTIVVHMHVWSV